MSPPVKIAICLSWRLWASQGRAVPVAGDGVPPPVKIATSLS
jgi:hypothetical protein